MAAIEAAVEQLSRTEGIRVERISSVYETKPVGLTDQPDFLNAVAEVSTTLSASSLLAHCLAIEATLGRVRNRRWGPRVIDIDMLLFGDARIDEPDLVVPHPRLKERAFAMVPLAELAPDATPFEGDATAALIAAELPDRRDVRLYAET